MFSRLYGVSLSACLVIMSAVAVGAGEQVPEDRYGGANVLVYDMEAGSFFYLDRKDMAKKALGGKEECSDIILEAHVQSEIGLETSNKSAPHFLNCNFRGGIDYLTAHWKNLAVNAQLGRRDAALAEVGLILHSLQSFYAFSNYVELAAGEKEKNKREGLSSLRPLELWTSKGQRSLLELHERQGLISGVKLTAEPNRCRGPDVPLKLLSKASREAPAGQVVRSKLLFKSQFDLARELAQDSSTRFVAYVLKEYPKILESCFPRFNIPASVQSTSGTGEP